MSNSNFDSSSTSPLVLISGVNGFIGSELALTFLRAGYTVRGTVRSQSKADAWSKLPSFTPYVSSGKVQLVIVPDITADGAFDEAVKGVDYFLHASSPLAGMDGSKDQEKDVLIPAIQGTLTALRAAVMEPGIKKVVILSSVASVVDYSQPSQVGRVYDETSWNPLTYEFAKTAPPLTAYAVSKALAEKSAWEFVEKEKPSFALVALNPTFVFGISHAPLDPKSPFLGGTNGFLAQLLLDPNYDFAKALGGPYFVDLRDVAAAHLLAIENDAADGRRFLITAPKSFPSDYARVLSDTQPPLPAKLPQVPRGFENPQTYELNRSASGEVLGLKYHEPEETLRETARWILKVAGKA